MLGAIDQMKFTFNLRIHANRQGLAEELGGDDDEIEDD